MCATCERNGRGGYAPQGSDDELSDAGSASGNDGRRLDEASSSQSSDSEEESDAETVNYNERRTRRGVYAVMPEASAAGQIELDKEADAEDPSGSKSTVSSVPTSAVQDLGLMTPEPDGEPRGRALHKSKGRETLSAPIAPVPRKPTPSASASVPFRSVISTRAQKAREASLEASASARTSRAPSKTVTGRSVSAARQQLITPPLTIGSAATSVRSSSRLRSAGDTISALTESSRVSTPVKDKKGKGRATASVSDARDIETHEPEARHLRPRASATVFDPFTLSKKKLDDAPRGLDGKPLPMCSTCGNILPVISVDFEIVWGLSVGRTGKRGRPKKDAAAECPRCVYFTPLQSGPVE